MKQPKPNGRAWDGVGELALCAGGGGFVGVVSPGEAKDSEVFQLVTGVPRLPDSDIQIDDLTLY